MVRHEGGVPMETTAHETKSTSVLVVGYDGTEPAQRALRSATEMLRDRPGRLEVVFVAHVPSTVAFSPQGLAAVREGMDREESDLTSAVEQALRESDVKWHFQRRNGEIALELLAAAKEQFDGEGPSTHVVLVLGGSSHKIDRYLNSTPARVIRQDRFEVLVVP
jgi:nucleotide-binding universal stress UspA family protein